MSLSSYSSFSNKHSCGHHLVAAELHARQVVPLDPELAALWHSRRRPAVDRRGQQAQRKPLLGRLHPSITTIGRFFTQREQVSKARCVLGETSVGSGQSSGNQQSWIHNIQGEGKAATIFFEVQPLVTLHA